MTAPDSRQNPGRSRRTDVLLALIVALWLAVIAALLVGVAALVFGGFGSHRLTWPTGPTGPVAPSAPHSPGVTPTGQAQGSAR